MRHLPLPLLLLSLVLLMVACGRPAEDEVRASTSAPCYIGEVTVASGTLWAVDDGALVGVASVAVGHDGLLELRVVGGCAGCSVEVGEWGGPARTMPGAGPWEVGAEWAPAHVMLVRGGAVTAVAFLAGGPSI